MWPHILEIRIQFMNHCLERQPRTLPVSLYQLNIDIAMRLSDGKCLNLVWVGIIVNGLS